MVLSQPLTVSSQPLVSMPGSSSSTLGGLEVQPQASLESQADVESHFDMLENMDAVVLLGGASGAGSGGAFPPLLDIPPDADDETMVELAIALSLQVRGVGAHCLAPALSSVRLVPLYSAGLKLLSAGRGVGRKR